MKKTIYLSILAFISMMSCKSIEKMVEKGQYDEAILFAAEKLQGEENKKTKYVTALEDAFYRVMQEDLGQIKRLEDSERAEFYGDIYNLYRKIEQRQSRIKPFLPLTSEDGYTATFRMIDPRNGLNQYAEKDAEYHYNRAVQLLGEYTPDKKEKARTAFTALNNVEYYFEDYKDMYDLKEKAYDWGVEHVLISTTIADHAFLDRQHEYILNQFNVDDLNRKWVEFHHIYEDDMNYDYEVILKVEDVRFDREKEVVNNYVIEKEIQEGFRYVLDAKGNVAKDSLGNDIKEPNYIIIRANITEVERSKNAEIIASIEVVDLQKNKVVDRQEIVSPVVFRGYGANYRGDKRALDKRAINRLDNYLEPYPSDYNMVYEGLVDIQNKARKKIKRVFS
jgi:hypothetical protein